MGAVACVRAVRLGARRALGLLRKVDERGTRAAPRTKKQYTAGAGPKSRGNGVRQVEVDNYEQDRRSPSERSVACADETIVNAATARATSSSRCGSQKQARLAEAEEALARADERGHPAAAREAWCLPGILRGRHVARAKVGLPACRRAWRRRRGVRVAVCPPGTSWPKPRMRLRAPIGADTPPPPTTSA